MAALCVYHSLDCGSSILLDVNEVENTSRSTRDTRHPRIARHCDGRNLISHKII